MRIFIATLVIIGAITLCTSFYFSTYPQNYFRSPITYTLRLAGTFGELRPNHFHAGLDIKSPNGAIGATIVAAADGHISRIIRGPYGFGNALFVEHPNGYTTVYGHLHEFTPPIEAYVKNMQYQEQSYEVDIRPPADLFPVLQGEQIAIMGNTGASAGPHLHFEIRETASGKPANPLLFGLKVTDNTAPRMHQLRVYQLNEQHEAISAKTYKLLHSGNNYRLEDTLEVNAFHAGFGLSVYDHMDDVPNWNGIYALSMYVNDSLAYRFRADAFSFDESRYLNAHLDYREQRTNGTYFHRTYILPGNKLSLYEHSQNGGVVHLQPNQAASIIILAEDKNGNTSRLQFWVRQRGIPSPKQQGYTYFLPYGEESLIDNGSLYLHFPEGIFYENIYLKYRFTIDHSDHVYSAMHHIHEPLTPVHHPFEIALRPTTLPEELRSKAFVAYCNKNGNVTNMGGEWKSDRLFAKSSTFGDYCILVDEVKPTIRPLNLKRDMKAAKSMTFKIYDNFYTGGSAKDLSYRATVDGQWIMLEKDGKTGILTYHFDEKIPPGEHQLRVVATDAVGNEAVFEAAFVR